MKGILSGSRSMTMKIFNTQFEVSMRILLLLSVYRQGLDQDRIQYLDFFTIYAKNYRLGNENINGNSSFMLNDLTEQHALFRDSIKELVVQGLITVKYTNQGFLYNISPEGIEVCSKMSSDYSVIYKKNSNLVKETIDYTSFHELKSYAKKLEGIKDEIY